VLISTDRPGRSQPSFSVSVSAQCRCTGGAFKRVFISRNSFSPGTYQRVVCTLIGSDGPEQRLSFSPGGSTTSTSTMRESRPHRNGPAAGKLPPKCSLSSCGNHQAAQRCTARGSPGLPVPLIWWHALDGRCKNFAGRLTPRDFRPGASSSSPEEAQPPREVQQGQETAEPTSRHMGKGPVTAVQPAVSGNHDACRASAPLLSSPLYFTSLLPMRGPAMRCFPRRMRSPHGSTGSGWPGRRGPLV
jgi:hypothetical protein